MTYVDILAELLTKAYKRYTSFSILSMFWNNRKFCEAKTDLNVLITIGKQVIEYSPPSYKIMQLAYVIGRIEGDIA